MEPHLVVIRPVDAHFVSECQTCNQRGMCAGEGAEGVLRVMAEWHSPGSVVTVDRTDGRDEPQ